MATNDWYSMNDDGSMTGGGSLDYGAPAGPVSQPTQTGYMSAADYDAARGVTRPTGPTTGLPAGYYPPPLMQGGTAFQPQQNYGGGGGGRSSGGGGVGMNAAPFSAPPSTFYNRLRSILENPSSIQNDPAYQFIRDQGEGALSRSAGARRMRFAGKTMQDFQDFGQRSSMQYLSQIANLLKGGAEEERQDYQYRLADAQRQDPTGMARRAASMYQTPAAYLAAVQARQPQGGNIGFASFGGQSNPTSFDPQYYTSQYDTGRRLLQGQY